MIKSTEVMVIGAGAAGLMCAIEAGKRQRQVIVFDHANKAGKKILMSGGGRCNFTNYHTHPDHLLSLSTLTASAVLPDPTEALSL